MVKTNMLEQSIVSVRNIFQNNWKEGRSLGTQLTGMLNKKSLGGVRNSPALQTGSTLSISMMIQGAEDQ